jgi:CDP-glucose 4,6-dehydratase
VAERERALEPGEPQRWRSSRVFVTGGSGLLGSALVEALVARGADVTVLLRDYVPASRLVDDRLTARTTIVGGDLLDLPLLVRVLNEYEIDTVFHLGAQTIVGTASRSPISTFESNIRGTWNLLEACRVNAGLIRRVIVASSDKAYGAHEQLPYTEQTPLQGRFPYDVSKSCADLLTLSYWHAYRTPVVVTRCGNLWGPGDLNYNRLIPGTIRSALVDEPPLIRSDGTFRRDYFFVRDAVEAYLMLADSMARMPLAGEAFNFGNEHPCTVLEIVERILTFMGKTRLRPVILNEASGEIPNQYLDCTKARQMLGVGAAVCVRGRSRRNRRVVSTARAAPVGDADHLTAVPRCPAKGGDTPRGPSMRRVRATLRPERWSVAHTPAETSARGPAAMRCRRFRSSCPATTSRT